MVENISYPHNSFPCLRYIREVGAFPPMVKGRGKIDGSEKGFLRGIVCQPLSRGSPELGS